MPRDGSGIHTKLAASVAVTATTIASNPYNLQVDDVVASLNDTVLLNGLKPFTGPQSMGSQKLTTMAAGTVTTDAANLGQVQSGINRHSASVGGTVDAITAVHAPVMTTWVGMTGFRGTFTATGANTSATPTFNPDGIGAKTLVKLNNLALVAGDIIGAGHEVDWEYNGTNVVILNPATLTNAVNTFTITSTDAAAASAPTLALFRDSPSPASADYAAQISLDANNSSIARKTYAAIKSFLSVVTAGSEIGSIDFWNINAGTFAERMYLKLGLVMSAATGGDKGAGTVNATGYYINGTLLNTGPTIITKTADETRTSTSTLTNDTHFTFSMLANINYKITGRYWVTTAFAAPGAKIGISGPAAPTSVLFTETASAAANGGTGSFGTIVNQSTSATASAAHAGATAGGEFLLDFEIIWKNGANAGTFAMQTAQQTSNGNATTFRANSEMSYVTF